MCITRTRLFAALLAVTSIALAALAAALPIDGDVAMPYEVVQNWPQPLHGDVTWGRVGSVFAESPDRVLVMQQGELPPVWKRTAIDPKMPGRSSAEAVHCQTFAANPCKPSEHYLVD